MVPVWRRKVYLELASNGIGVPSLLILVPRLLPKLSNLSQIEGESLPEEPWFKASK